MISGPGGDRLGTEASHRYDFGVDRVACLIYGKGYDNENDLRSANCLADRLFSAEVRIIDLDLSPQHRGIIPIAHGPQNLVVK